MAVVATRVLSEVAREGDALALALLVDAPVAVVGRDDCQSAALAVARADVPYVQPWETYQATSAGWRYGAAWEGDGLPQYRRSVSGLGVRADARAYTLTVAPGCIQTRAFDASRAERAREAERAHRAKRVALLEEDARRPEGEEREDRPTRAVSEWSRKSRRNMMRTVASLDYSTVDTTRTRGMLTLTYPGDWQAVAPSGEDAKRHLQRFFAQWRRSTGEAWVGIWKLEFQRRGAPHFHLWSETPALVGGERFEHWLSRTWARIVGAVGDERERHEAAGTRVDFGFVGTSDPGRLAWYFLKHGQKTTDDKEYQHVVPGAWREEGKGPGRFWGVRGIRSGAVEVAVSPAAYYRLRRVQRRLQDARRYRVWARARARRGEPAVAVPAHVKGPRRRNGGAPGGAWSLVGDGVRIAYGLARWLAETAVLSPA